MASDSIFNSAQWYDRSINWSARTAREVPVLTDVMGPPDCGRLLDAGCGTARQVRALAELGYHVVGADASREMIDEGRRVVDGVEDRVDLVVTPYASLHEHVGGGFHGVYCLGNALAAAGSGEEVARALSEFAKCLNVGGRAVLQILNFRPMRDQEPCIRGPRIASVEGREYISWRHFCFHPGHVVVTNVSMWHEDGWRKRAHSGRLYPIELDELRTWLHQYGMRTDHVWGSYKREPFDPDRSVDLIVAATRVS